MLIQFWLQFYVDTTIPMLNTFNIRTLLTLYPGQQHFSSKWTKVNSGGRYQKNTFYHNVGYRVLIEQESVSTSLTIILHQIPYTNSKDTPITSLQNHHPIGRYVFLVTDKNVKLKESPPLYSDAEFIRARSISKIVQIHKGHEYYVVLTCFEPNSEAAYDLTFLSDILLSITKTESIDILKPRVVTPPKNKTQPLFLKVKVEINK
ncbi:unnamed protein product [Didymodactylos carnosus]|uniref:Peptidase C2 calpain large subunit domain-containing protein n=2 Tax=Didymodactylos carnosus TaxID=1234261 RepID=A0A8S2WC30_9BILA|nr:unnamed protein product [Didymodactylos carnosus]